MRKIEELNGFYLEKEKVQLGRYALKSDNKLFTKRLVEHTNTDFRIAFQRDRDRIIHSRSFRRLMHKTQVFNANIGDHYRNRLTHTMEVCQIARSIGKMLCLNDELIEAIALGHDVGHTPFGHIGERTLHMIISGKMNNGDNDFSSKNHGGFKHNYQALQMLDNVEKRCSEYKGVDLTFAVREGIFKHTSSKIKVPKSEMINDRGIFIKDNVFYSSLNLENMKVDNCSMTLEGQVVAIADEIAQCTHDLEDGIRSGIITYNDLRKSDLINKLEKEEGLVIDPYMETVDFRNSIIRRLVGYFIEDVYTETSRKLELLETENRVPMYSTYNDCYTNDTVTFSDEVNELQKSLASLITNLVIASQEVNQADRKSEYIIKKLFVAYYMHPQQLPDYILKRYYDKMGKSLDRITIDSELKTLQNNSDFIRLICDHIGCMTDQYASREYKKLYVPEFY